MRPPAPDDSIVHAESTDVLPGLLDGSFQIAYDYGARSKRRWPTKHDTVLVYVKDSHRYYFDPGAVDREPYMGGSRGHARAASRGFRDA